jgi:hypothetical protein
VPAKVIFDSVLGAAFEPSDPFMISADRVVLDWLIVVTGEDLTQIEWYIELASDDPNAVATTWFREVAEQNTVGPGTTNMPKVVRIWREADGTLLAPGTHAVDAELTRSHQFCRVQVRVAAGAGTARIFAPFAGDTISP